MVETCAGNSYSEGMQFNGKAHPIFAHGTIRARSTHSRAGSGRSGENQAWQLSSPPGSLERYQHHHNKP
eukprot:1161580-Pelagomonas_calceolata.AAC.4